jgi:hypothetical protein
MTRASLLAFVLIATAAGGQTPAPAAQIASSSLSGTVRNIAGAPLADVNVTLLGESAATRTDSGGNFALRDVSPVSHTVLFRRIGYGSVEYRWIAKPDGAVRIQIVMTPIAQQLNRVIVEAPGTSRKRGTSSIGGTVIDTAGRAVSGADIRVLGSGMSTVTDSTGRFEFQTLAAGSYIVRARRQGLTSVNYIMQIADDDARGITLKMHVLPRKSSSRDGASDSGYGVSDGGFDAFDRRERIASTIVVLGPGDLFRASGASLEFVLQQYLPAALTAGRRTSAVATGMGSADDGDCLLIDGRRAMYQPLRTFTAREVQLVEVIRTSVWPDEFVLSQMGGLAECRGTMDHHPIYVVLWTRSVH